MIERLAAVIVVAILIAVAVVASSRKFGLRPQKALLECLAEHDPRCIGDGAVREGWRTVPARYPDLPNYRAGRA